VKIRHEVLDWFGPSCGVIALHPVLMYYAIEFGFSFFLSGFFEIFLGCLLDILDVDLSPLFIVGESPHKI
jgi:hypothetical protein